MCWPWTCPATAPVTRWPPAEAGGSPGRHRDATVGGAGAVTGRGTGYSRDHPGRHRRQRSGRDRTGPATWAATSASYCSIRRRGPRPTPTSGCAGLPALTPVWSGGHLLEAWHLVRDSRLFSPWFRREPAGIRPGEPDLDDARIQRDVRDLLRANGAWQALLRDALGYRDRGATPKSSQIIRLEKAPINWARRPDAGWRRERASKLTQYRSAVYSPGKKCMPRFGQGGRGAGSRQLSAKGLSNRASPTVVSIAGTTCRHLNTEAADPVQTPLPPLVCCPEL